MTPQEAAREAATALLANSDFKYWAANHYSGSQARRVIEALLAAAPLSSPVEPEAIDRAYESGRRVGHLEGRDDVLRKQVNARSRPLVAPPGLDLKALRAAWATVAFEFGIEYRVNKAEFTARLAAEYARLLPTQASDSPEKP